MKTVFVVGLIFGIAFLMLIGLVSVLRELFARVPSRAYPPALDDDPNE
jgi:hypothetical protein